MNVTLIREAMANALSAITGVAVSVYAVAQPTPPGLQVLGPAVDYDYTMRDLDSWQFIVQGFASLSSTDLGTQMILDQFTGVGAGSVKGALEADPTLEGVVQSCYVERQESPVVVERAGVPPMLLVEWRVRIIA